MDIRSVDIAVRLEQQVFIIPVSCIGADADTIDIIKTLPFEMEIKEVWMVLTSKLAIAGATNLIRVYPIIPISNRFCNWLYNELYVNSSVSYFLLISIHNTFAVTLSVPCSVSRIALFSHRALRGSNSVSSP